MAGPTGQPFRYGGAESLITIAAPGTGKSQVQAIPNLLSYPGSAFVLDVKGELWDATAGYRARHFGPVYRFAPTDPDGQTNAYNPFDFVSLDPEQAGVDCEVIASQIIPPNAGSKDPFWDNRGRDFLKTFRLMVALRHRRKSAIWHSSWRCLRSRLTSPTGSTTRPTRHHRHPF